MATISHELIKYNELANTMNWVIGLPLPSFISEAMRIAEEFIASGTNGYIKNPENYLNLYCKDCEIPTRKIQYEEVEVNRKYYHQPVYVKSSNSLKFTFFEPNNYNVSRIFEFWGNYIIDPFNQTLPLIKGYLPRGFSISALNNFPILNPYNKSSGIQDKNPVANWELFHVKPEEVTYKPLGNTAEYQEVSVTLRFLNFKRNF